jgi:hypothetical protein
MDTIERGLIRLRYFTVKRDDFATSEPQPPWRYFLVTQVFSADDEYQCTQLLGIDLRAVKSFELQGFPFQMPADLSRDDQNRIKSSLMAYARYVTNRIANCLLKS